MHKILTIIGARPQFIKAAPVCRALAATGTIQEVLLHTGQHFDHRMSEVFFEQMDIPRPRYNLGIHSMTHGAMTGRMLEAIEGILLEEKPDHVMVYGDTNSTLAGALAAAKGHIPVAHVEAGLRSFNTGMPEEINRILTDRVSSLLFCPTKTAAENLEKEGFAHFGVRIEQTGDVMLDAALMFLDRASAPEGIRLPEDFVLATVHRAENTDNPDRLQEVVDGLRRVSESIPVVFPVHPRTWLAMQRMGGPGLSGRILRLEPQGYLQMLWLLKHCRMVMTDSGGLQKEACFFKKPCITLRRETEWTELTDSGCNVLCGTDPEAVSGAASDFMAKPPAFPDGLYGNGNAASKIAAAFLSTRS
jgi:UDP-GlcNAc3NAcA epimerase